MPGVNEGERFRLTRDYRGHGAVEKRGGGLGQFTCEIPKGTVLVSRQTVDVFAEGFRCVPEDYARIEEELVPGELRNDPDYAGYFFVFFLGDRGALLEELGSAGD
jgi:hypothetical protein